MLRTLGEKENWEDHLPHMLHVYNCTKHEATGFSPYYLLHDRHPHLPADILFGLITDQETEIKESSGYVERWAGKMTEGYQIANANSQQSSLKGKTYYDKKSRGVVRQPGDRVLVCNLGERGDPGKLRNYWEQQIFNVREQMGDNPVYKVSPEGGGRPVCTLHQNLLLQVQQSHKGKPKIVQMTFRPDMLYCTQTQMTLTKRRMRTHLVTGFEYLWRDPDQTFTHPIKILPMLSKK
ncbi:PREDICTED: uncharacterized protein LOC106904922 [Poecilia mexicana]|uniref:uncharacterized protein LOC106904922 n=1 Tax=Poecilia mexicana TaxID=48701 RepID=UPI00072E1823|nr:PREDICTED: uncharacterized protein LOC106904922 [Poecilia mexicana]